MLGQFNTATSADISNDDSLKPGTLKGLYLVKVNFCNKQSQQFYIAECLWLKEHPYKDEYGRHCPMKIWSTSYETENIPRFLAIDCIKKKCTLVKTMISFKPNHPIYNRTYRQADLVNIVIPLSSKSII